MKPRYPDIVVKLSEIDGNAFNVMAAVKRAMQEGGVPLHEIDPFIEQSQIGDYQVLLATCAKMVTIE